MFWTHIFQLCKNLQSLFCLTFSVLYIKLFLKQKAWTALSISYGVVLATQFTEDRI